MSIIAHFQLVVQVGSKTSFEMFCALKFLVVARFDAAFLVRQLILLNVVTRWHEHSIAVLLLHTFGRSVP